MYFLDLQSVLAVVVQCWNIHVIKECLFITINYVSGIIHYYQYHANKCSCDDIRAETQEANTDYLSVVFRRAQ